MKNRFKTMSAAFTLTFMLLFGAVAFARTANAGIANPNMGSTGVPSAQRWDIRRHRRHERRRYMRRENREMGRRMRENR